MAEYRFVTFWQIEAPLQAVFDVVFDSLHWPDWWQGAEQVEQLAAGDRFGIGSVRRYTWKSLLPYRLRFDARATRIEAPTVLEAVVDGDLQGNGCWTFSHDEGITTVRYAWDVHTTKRWMNLLSPVAHAVFAYNHHVLMQRGAEGVARVLGSRLAHVSYIELPSRLNSRQPGPWADYPDRATPGSGRSSINWMAAAGAGLVAGVVATFVQLLLWWAASYALPDVLLRDARLAAAIVMGRSVLPPPASFDLSVMLVATLVHFVLSVSFGILQAPLVARLRILPALLTGTGFGLVLFGTNMYGFTALFPWFEASRDWITAIAHASFGLSAALVYKLWKSRQTVFTQQWAR